jgi:two-component system NtrC family sensor kinase
MTENSLTSLSGVFLPSKKQTKLAEKKTIPVHRIEELEKLVDTISRGKMQWEHTFDVITDPVSIINKDYIITRANKALARASKMDVRDVIGKRCYEVFAGYTSPCPRCPVEKTLKGHNSHAVELEAFPKKKRQYFVNVHTLPEEEPNHEEIVLHYRDITDERQLQRQLMQTDKMAAIGTLAGGVAHEINNPLAAILAFTQLAIRELEETHLCQDNLKEIEDATLRCKKIVRDLLDFSRQSFEERMQPLNLNEVIQKAMNLIQVNARHSQINIVQNLSHDLPMLIGHMHKLQQVLLNFVTNAMHAMKDGGILTISTSQSADRRHLLLEIEDTGDGIDGEDLDKIFDPYFTTKEQGEGTGLGLSISYNIVQEHKGSIAVESRKRQGTKFTITFPSLGM